MTHPDPRAGWEHPNVKPLDLRTIRATLRASQSTNSARLVYAILLTHADALGGVTAYVDEIADVAHIGLRQTRLLLSHLCELGELRRVYVGTGRWPSVWQITAIAQPAA